MIALPFGQAQVGLGKGHILLGGRGHPALNGVVVVSTGVHHAVGGVTVGQVVAARVPAVEGELQDFHAGVAGLLKEFFHRGGKEAQILGDDVLFAQSLVHDFEKINARPGAPAAVFGGVVPKGNGIVGVEAPEMVDAQSVANLELPGDPLEPPGVAVLLHLLPVEQRVAPQLAVGGETVRWAAGHLGGPAVLVQLELFRVGPHVGAVQGHIDGQVANNGDAFLIDILLQAPPLAEKEMLHPLPEVDLSGQLFFHLLQSGRLTQTQLLRPIQPGGPAVLVFQGHEQGVVLQPVRPPEGAPHIELVPP